MLPRVSLVRLLTGNQVLELQRGPEDSKPGREWDLPGGHAEERETPDYTAARELKEETGISVRPSTLSMVKVFERADGKMFYVFEMRTVGKPPVRLSSEHVGYRWRKDDGSSFGRT
jgi:8-oxo-dGTP pyrophosphatase MutT (NUDIX family)